MKLFCNLHQMMSFSDVCTLLWGLNGQLAFGEGIQNTISIIIFPLILQLFSKKGPLGRFYYWFSRNKGGEKVMFSSLYTLPFIIFHLTWANWTLYLCPPVTSLKYSWLIFFPLIITLHYFHILRWFFFCFSLHLTLTPSSLLVPQPFRGLTNEKVWP